MVTAVFSAVTLKLCCWGPFLLTSVAGVSGSAVYFSWLITLKPYLLAISFLSLGMAFYQVYKPEKVDCCCSENFKTEKKPFLKSKLYVWLVAAFVVLMTSLSYFSQVFLHRHTNEREIIIINESDIRSVKLNIEGISCAVCEENINHSVNQLEGILKIKTSHKTGISEIEFDKTKTNISDIQEAIQSKGYLTKHIENE